MQPTKGQRRLSPDRRRELLLDAGQTLFGLHAYAGVSLSAISDLAGVSRPLIQHYFGNKAKLYHAVYARAFDQMRDLLIDPDAPLDPGTVRAHMTTYFAFANTHPAGALVAAGASMEGRSHIGGLVTAFIDDVTASILSRLPLTAQTMRMKAALNAWSYLNIGLTLQLALTDDIASDDISVAWAADHATNMLFATIATQTATQTAAQT